MDGTLWSIPRYGAIDFCGPSVYATVDIDHLAKTVALEKTRHLQAAYAVVAQAGNRLLRVQFSQASRNITHGDCKHAVARAMVQVGPAQLVRFADIQHERSV